MRLKTDIHVNVDLRLSSDEPQTDADLARLAVVLDGLQMLLRAQQQIDSAAPALASVALPALPEPVAVAQPEQPAEPSPIMPVANVQPAAPATNGHGGRGRPPASRAWSFEEFDRQVQAEMKKLARGGVMPGQRYWDLTRDRRLPTLQGVIKRYGLTRSAQLAERLGYLPPMTPKAADAIDD